MDRLRVDEPSLFALLPEFEGNPWPSASESRISNFGETSREIAGSYEPFIADLTRTMTRLDDDLVRHNAPLGTETTRALIETLESCRGDVRRLQERRRILADACHDTAVEIQAHKLRLNLVASAVLIGLFLLRAGLPITRAAPAPMLAFLESRTIAGIITQIWMRLAHQIVLVKVRYLALFGLLGSLIGVVSEGAVQGHQWLFGIRDSPSYGPLAQSVWSGFIAGFLLRIPHPFASFGTRGLVAGMWMLAMNTLGERLSTGVEMAKALFSGELQDNRQAEQLAAFDQQSFLLGLLTGIVNGPASPPAGKSRSIDTFLAGEQSAIAHDVPTRYSLLSGEPETPKLGPAREPQPTAFLDPHVPEHAPGPGEWARSPEEPQQRAASAQPETGTIPRWMRNPEDVPVHIGPEERTVLARREEVAHRRSVDELAVGQRTEPYVAKLVDTQLQTRPLTELPIEQSVEDGISPGHVADAPEQATHVPENAGAGGGAGLGKYVINTVFKKGLPTVLLGVNQFFPIAAHFDDIPATPHPVLSQVERAGSNGVLGANREVGIVALHIPAASQTPDAVPRVPHQAPTDPVLSPPASGSRKGGQLPFSGLVNRGRALVFRAPLPGHAQHGEGVMRLGDRDAPSTVEHSSANDAKTTVKGQSDLLQRALEERFQLADPVLLARLKWAMLNGTLTWANVGELQGLRTREEVDAFVEQHLGWQQEVLNQQLFDALREPENFVPSDNHQDEPVSPVELNPEVVAELDERHETVRPPESAWEAEAREHAEASFWQTLRDIPTHAELLVGLAWQKRPDLVLAGGVATLAYAAANVWFLHELASFVPMLLDLPEVRHVGPPLVNAVLDVVNPVLRAFGVEAFPRLAGTSMTPELAAAAAQARWLGALAVANGFAHFATQTIGKWVAPNVRAAIADDIRELQRGIPAEKFKESSIGVQAEEAFAWSLPAAEQAALSLPLYVAQLVSAAAVLVTAAASVGSGLLALALPVPVLLAIAIQLLDDILRRSTQFLNWRDALRIKAIAGLFTSFDAAMWMNWRNVDRYLAGLLRAAEERMRLRSEKYEQKSAVLNAVSRVVSTGMTALVAAAALLMGLVGALGPSLAVMAVGAATWSLRLVRHGLAHLDQVLNHASGLERYRTFRQDALAVHPPPSYVRAPDELAEIILRNVYANEDGHPVPVAKGYSLNFKPGKLYMLVGGSGTGKSTLMDLLLGTLQPSQGQVLWKGTDGSVVDASEIEMSWRYQKTTLIAQERTQPPKDAGSVYLLSVADQPRLLDKEDHDRAAEMGAWHSVQRKLKNGDNTFIHRLAERFQDLSGGQRQRLDILSAVLATIAGKKVIIADEPNSALDPKTSQEVIEALRQVAEEENAIVVVSIHHKELWHLAHELLVMEQGRVLDQGSYAALLERNELFQRLLGLAD